MKAFICVLARCDSDAVICACCFPVIDVFDRHWVCLEVSTPDDPLQAIELIRAKMQVLGINPKAHLATVSCERRCDMEQWLANEAD